LYPLLFRFLERLLLINLPKHTIYISDKGNELTEDIARYKIERKQMMDAQAVQVASLEGSIQTLQEQLEDEQNKVRKYIQRTRDDMKQFLLQYKQEY